MFYLICFMLYLTMSLTFVLPLIYYIFCLCHILIVLNLLALNIRKYQNNKSVLVFTPTKRKGITALLQIFLSQRKNANNVIFCAIARNFHPVHSSSHPILVEYLLLDQIWIVFVDLYLS